MMYETKTVIMALRERLNKQVYKIYNQVISSSSYDMFPFKKNKKVNIFSKGNGEEEDDDELFSGANSSDKLASLFDDDSSSNHSRTLKYVAPKQPLKDTSIVQPPLQHERAAAALPKDTTSEVLYATNGTLFSYKNSEVFNIGPVMCCIIHVRIKNSFTLLIYKIKTNIISSTEIIESFNLSIQQDNYLAFTDDNKSQWTLHIDGIHYEEFVTQIGICRAYSSSTVTSPPVVVTQRLSEGKGDYPLQIGDNPEVSISSWRVENWKKGRILSSREKIKLNIDSGPDWHAGLINCRLNERRLIFIQGADSGKISFTTYDVTIVSLPSQESDVTPRDNTLPAEATQTKYENIKSKKATLISRMAKVGQPLLPASPRRVQNPPSLPTDSESDEDRVQRRLRGHMTSNNTRSSTSSSVEEIHLANKEYNKIGDVSVDTRGHHQDFMTNIDHFNRHQNVPLGQGQLIAYQPPTMLQQHQQQLHHLQQELELLKQQKESSKQSQGSEALLSLLFSESRTQNTDLRVALSQLTQKVDLVYDKINTVGPNLHYTNSSTTDQTFQTTAKPRELLGQITDLVEQVEKYKKKMDEKEQRIEELTKDYTQILKKNQMLLEEKSELINLKNENLETSSQNKIQIQELFSIQEEKIKTQNELDLSKEEIKKLKKELEVEKSKHTNLQQEIETFRQNDNERSTLLVELERENDEKLRQNVDDLSKLKEALEEKSKKYEQIVEKITEENENFKDKIRLIEKEKSDLESELKSKHDLELELKEGLELELNAKRVLESELVLKNEQISKLKDENIVKKQLVATVVATGTNTEPETSSSSAPTSEDLETLGKDIMNSAYKKLKKEFGSSESYTKQVILENVIMAFRETILDYTEARKASMTEQSRQEVQISRNKNETKNGHTMTNIVEPSATTRTVIPADFPAVNVTSDTTNAITIVPSDIPSVLPMNSALPNETTIYKALDSSTNHIKVSDIPSDAPSNIASVVTSSNQVPTLDDADATASVLSSEATSVQELKNESDPRIKNDTIVLSSQNLSSNLTNNECSFKSPEASSEVLDKNQTFKSEIEAVDAASVDNPSSPSAEHLSLSSAEQSLSHSAENTPSPSIEPTLCPSEVHTTVCSAKGVNASTESDSPSIPSAGVVTTDQFDEDDDKTWKTGPPPPPPPLFSDSEEDDDWLS